MRKEVVDIAYPGQSEDVRVGLGVVVVRAYEDGAIDSCCWGWMDGPYPDATLSWEEFSAKYRGHPVVERQERDRKRRDSV